MSTRPTVTLPHWTRVAGLAVVTVAVAFVTVVGALWSAGTAAPVPDGVTVIASPTAALVDGTKVNITVKAASDVVINQMVVKQCRLGATYEAPDDIEYYRGSCAAGPVSSSADGSVIRDQEGFFVLSRRPEGLVVPFKVGVGTAEWTIPGSGPASLTCGPADPCALVVRLRIAGKTHYWTTRLDFVESDPLAACGGANPASLSSGGSDELSDAWATWTRQFCTTGAGAGGAPTTASFGGGEGPAVTGFSSGLNDIAYTAAGYNPDVGLSPVGATTRNAVAVPIALNAAVIATGSGRLQTVDGLPIGKATYPTLELTTPDAAAMVAGGLFWIDRSDQPYRDSILGRNPELDNLMYYSGGAVDTAGVYAQSLPLASSYYLTEYLATNAAAHFFVPGSNPPTPRVASANFAQATPAYSTELKLVSGRPALRRVTEQAALNQTVPGPIWTVTDLATAKALELGTTAIEVTPGVFVEPTPDSMRAALATMTKDGAGLLQPDPTAAAADVRAGADAPYPLTYVIYALVPAEPLTDSLCQPRAKSQALLADWLTYVTGDGQAVLPPGLVGLTPALRDEAKAQIAKVGAAPITGICAPPATRGDQVVQPPSSTGTPVAAPRVTPRAPSAPPAASPAAAAASGDTVATETLEMIPAFAGRRIADTTGGIVALVGIALVSSLGLFLTARATAGETGAFRGEAGFTTLDRRRGLGMVGLWCAIAVAGVMLVVFQLGPMLQQRDQRALFDDYTQEIDSVAFATQGLPQGGGDATLRPPEPGSPVGILEIGELRTQEVVVEGIGATQTASGPGHVPGTAGIGQPGNSVVVGRRNAYGGPFGRLDEVRRGDTVVVTTTQGQSVYVVKSIEERPVTRRLFGPSADDRLTLVTSADSSPMNADDALVVTATLRDLPFPPTAQGARTDQATSIDPAGGWSAVALAVALYGVVLGLGLVAYRKFSFPIAYILTVAPVVAVTVLLAESLTGLLPAWM